MVNVTEPPDLRTQQGRLRHARMRQHPSMRAAARANGWNENTYKSHEQGMRREGALSEADAKKYARAFGVSDSWLLSGRGDMTRQGGAQARAPVQAESHAWTAQLVGLVGAGAVVEAIELHDQDPIELPADAGDVEAYRVTGSSCAPVFEDGDVVIVLKRASEDRFINRYCVVQTAGGLGYLKKVGQGPKVPGQKLYTLHGSDEGEDTDTQQIAWAKPVVMRIMAR